MLEQQNQGGMRMKMVKYSVRMEQVISWQDPKHGAIAGHHREKPWWKI